MTAYKRLILTEKPSVARDFAKALGVPAGKGDGYLEDGRYIVTWAIGHLVELLEPHEYNPRWKRWSLDALPILPDEFAYKPIPSSKKQLGIVRRLLKREEIGEFIVATDAGREGEVIARTILLTADVAVDDRVKRFWTSQALTPSVIREGMAALKPASEYDRLWRAGQARQIADWLVGMNGTRAVTKRIRTPWSRASGKKGGRANLFSVGRVQTAVLALLVDRRREREIFKPEPFWILRARFVGDKCEWWGNWFREKRTKFDVEAEAEAVKGKIDGQTGAVASVSKQKRSQPPPPLYSLTDLQQEANRKFGISAKMTLTVAQRLYEEKKCLSYPRTDARVLGTKNVELARELVERLSGVYPEIFAGVKNERIQISNTRVFNDARLTDHHALIPLAPLPASASKDERRIYDLVLRRFSAAFHPDHEYEQTEIITAVRGESFRSKGKRTLAPGWKAVYADETPVRKKPDDDPEAEPENLPAVEKGDPAEVAESRLIRKMTQPPPEYSDALLLKDMTQPGRYVEEEALKRIYLRDTGLGTQATRAQIIETLLDRDYVAREKRHLKATDKGCRLIAMLRRFRHASPLTSPEETARWEMQLEQIAEGKASETDFLDGIKRMVTDMVNEFKENAENGGFGPCPVCGGSIIKGKRDYGCANWRDKDGRCRFVIRSEMAGKAITPRMLSELLERKEAGPFAGFTDENGETFNAVVRLFETEGGWEVALETSDAPVESKGEAQTAEVIGKCPACGGDVVETSKAYGCANWREEDGGCKFTIWKEVAKKMITPKMAKNLLENGRVGPLDKFISKKGKPFSASLKLAQEEGAWKVAFDFDDDKTASGDAGSGGGEGEAIGKCPACGADVVEKPKLFGCVNWREEDGGCKFAIWKSVARKDISKQTARLLLEKGETDVIFGFISRKGSAFAAKLRLEDPGDGIPKVVFEFPD